MACPRYLAVKLHRRAGASWLWRGAPVRQSSVAVIRYSLLLQSSEQTAAPLRWGSEELTRWKTLSCTAAPQPWWWSRSHRQITLRGCAVPGSLTSVYVLEDAQCFCSRLGPISIPVRRSWLFITEHNRGCIWRVLYVLSRTYLLCTDSSYVSLAIYCIYSVLMWSFVRVAEGDSRPYVCFFDSFPHTCRWLNGSQQRVRFAYPVTSLSFHRPSPVWISEGHIQQAYSSCISGKRLEITVDRSQLHSPPSPLSSVKLKDRTAVIFGWPMIKAKWQFPLDDICCHFRSTGSRAAGNIPEQSWKPASRP